jgi:hypothetical protein
MLLSSRGLFLEFSEELTGFWAVCRYYFFVGLYLNIGIYGEEYKPYHEFKRCLDCTDLHSFTIPTQEGTLMADR